MKKTSGKNFSLEEFLQEGSPSDVEVRLAENLAVLSNQACRECEEQRARAASILNEIVGGEPRSTSP